MQSSHSQLHHNTTALSKRNPPQHHCLIKKESPATPLPYQKGIPYNTTALWKRNSLQHHCLIKKESSATHCLIKKESLTAPLPYQKGIPHNTTALSKRNPPQHHCLIKKESTTEVMMVKTYQNFCGWKEIRRLKAVSQLEGRGQRKTNTRKVNHYLT